MDEAYLLELKKDVNNLINQAADETKNVHRLRSEIEQLKAEKDAFLAQRLKDELLLLEEATQQLEEARKQVFLNKELAERIKQSTADEWEKIKKEQLNLSVLEQKVEDDRNSITAFLLRVGREKEEAKEQLQAAKEAYQEGTKRASDAHKLLQDVKYRLEKVDEERNALKSWEEKNRQRTIELSDWELKIRNRSKEVEIKYNDAMKALAEAQKLVLWHQEMQKV